MMFKPAAIVLLSLLSLSVFGQSENQKPVTRPDIPGTFTLELGVNRGLEAPDNFDLGLWGSRTLNVYYQYELRVLRSRISVVPGIGFGLERFKFRDGSIIGFGENTESIRLIPVSEHDISRLRKSQLIANYIDLPVEIRYSTNPDDPARSFKISVGGRVGYLYDGFSKIKFSEGGEIKQIKDKQTFNLNRFRYGALVKLGIGNFSLFGYYNASSLFKENEGFYNANEEPVNFSTFTAGISLSSF